MPTHRLTYLQCLHTPVDVPEQVEEKLDTVVLLELMPVLVAGFGEKEDNGIGKLFAREIAVDDALEMRDNARSRRLLLPRYLHADACSCVHILVCVFLSVCVSMDVRNTLG